MSSVGQKMPHGGHFAAPEEPELLAEDIRALFRLRGKSSVRWMGDRVSINAPPNNLMDVRTRATLLSRCLFTFGVLGGNFAPMRI